MAVHQYMFQKLHADLQNGSMLMALLKRTIRLSQASSQFPKELQSHVPVELSCSPVPPWSVKVCEV